ncbi:M56 family metallopeptidase [Salinibacterium sp. SYSU T00001]|uniref:M56 family metallopeptidase n=1 Tax=Homoserinimonas sedimenticola TaxID=2986805 RepID=UPI0022361E5B|nr:M56 family metallopeptidase [Salinibacterium sedimenticola]MCW4384385.1 M56 family metallopeptidase [Salinibacterium sedimenticola]
MLPASLALAALAVALAWPVPLALARAAWPARAPAVALIVWQAIALAGGLSMIGSLLVFGLTPFGEDLVRGLASLLQHLLNGTLPEGATLPHTFALSGAVLLAVHLVLNLMLAAVRASRSRSRHRQLLALLSRPDPEHPGARLLDEAAPVAYCLPGATRSVTVLSDGLLEILDAEELAAVIAHEEAHARQRHHLLLLAFGAWRRSLPWFPIATRALDAVAVLVEMLADDRARRQASEAVLARSIARVALGLDGVAGRPRPGADVAENLPETLGASEPAALRRIERLVSAAEPLGVMGRVTALAASAALLLVPTALLLAPALA